MIANEDQFPGGRPGRNVLLGGLGLAGNGGGGLGAGAQTVRLPAGTHLFRIYYKPDDFGEWWFTPHELARIRGHFGLSMEALMAGRKTGRSMMHGVLALLGEWYGHSPAQLSRFHLAVTTKPLNALYGCGREAWSEDFSRTLKPVRLDGGKTARQVYLPRAWTYRDAFSLLTGADADAETGLIRAADGLPPQILPFER